MVEKLGEMRKERERGLREMIKIERKEKETKCS